MWDILGAILAKIPNFRDFRVKPSLKFVRDPTAGTKSQIPLANKVLFEFDLQNALTTNPKDDRIIYIFFKILPQNREIWVSQLKSIYEAPQ